MNSPLTTQRQDPSSHNHETDRREAGEQMVQDGNGSTGTAATSPRGLRFGQRLVSIILKGCALLPLAVLVWAICKYAVNIPVLDEWQLAQFFEKLGRGTLRVSDLFALQNEYRQFFPNLIIVSLGWVTHWDTRAEAALSVLLSCFISFGLWRLSRRTVPTVSRHPWINPALFVGINLLIFSLNQWENWFMGEQIVYFIPVACLLAGLLAATSGLRFYLKFFTCMVLSTIAIYSSPNGVLCWLLLFPRRSLYLRDERVKIQWLAGWVVVAAAELALYFYGYHTPPRHPSVLTALQHPGDAVTYFLAFLGSPLVPSAPYLPQSLPIGVAVGGLLLLAFAYVCILIRRRPSQDRRELLQRAEPWLALSGYSLFSAGIVMVGRVGFGTEKALSSRYLAFSIYLIIALIWLALILIDYGQRRTHPVEQSTSRVGRSAKLFAVTVSVALVAISLATFNSSVLEMEKKRRGLLYDKSCILLINYLPTRTLDVLAERWGIRNVVQTINNLNRLDLLRPHLSKDRDILKSAPNGEVADPNYGYVDEFELTPGGELFVRGWAVLPNRGRPADAIAFTYRDSLDRYVVFEVIRVGLKRPDVAQLLKSNEFLGSGWSETLKPLKGLSRIVQFDAWAIDSTSRKAYRLMDPQIINLSPDAPPAGSPSQATP